MPFAAHTETGTCALSFSVQGTPAPQGSKRHVGGGRMVESSAKVKPWREAVKWAALEAMRMTDTTHPITGPVKVNVEFYLKRPDSHYGTGKNRGQLKPSAPALPTVYPDIEKCLRSTYDALTEAGVYVDDKQVTDGEQIKRYADKVSPGAWIDVVAIEVTS